MEENKENEFQEDIEMTEGENTIEPEIEEIEDNSNNKIKTLRDKLKKCEVEKMTHLENLQRAKAEFLNGKKRLEEDKKRDKQRAENKQIEKLLPMADSFHMAMHDKKAWNAIDEQWRKGVESIHSQLHNILESYGVTEMNPKGVDFDPNLHEAMINVPIADKKLNNKVISVIQNGFLRKDGDHEELIRPARVTIGEYTEEH
ncbi:MAG: molecular chaperone GrpE [Acidimicrobiales bacterium]|jgi:molecular chaperone GrpE